MGLGKRERYEDQGSGDQAGNHARIEIDLDKANVARGDYHLTGFWDWTPFTASGDIHVRPLSEFKDARLDAASQDGCWPMREKFPSR